MTYRGMIAAVPGNKKEYLIPVIDNPMPEKDKAREIMIRTYFEHFGPATPADCRYFFGGWSSSELNPLLQKIIPEMYESTINGKKYYSVKEPETDAEIPDCVLVPGFDQLVLGYKDRSRIISENNTRKLTNISGIVFPSVIVRNKIRARWKLDKGTVSIIPFEKLYKKDELSVKRKVSSVFGKETHVIFESG